MRRNSVEWRDGEKISGVVVDGPVRDIDESAGLDFPVFARKAIPTTAHGRIVEEAFNEPITFDDVTVHPGDLALADGSGICFLAVGDAARVVETAERIAWIVFKHEDNRLGLDLRGFG